jgi:hypothetical protein
MIPKEKVEKAAKNYALYNSGALYEERAIKDFIAGVEFAEKEIGDWNKLAKIGTPDKWLKVYEHYQQLLIQRDVTEFWKEQYEIANAERNELKAKINVLKHTK